LRALSPTGLFTAIITSSMGMRFLPLFEIRRVIARLLFLFRRPFPRLVGLLERTLIRFLAGIVGGRFFAHRAPPYL
jgi:hypothetical protein